MENRIFEISERALKGPICEPNDFDRMITTKIRSLIKEYDIKYDPQVLIPTDTSLIDDVYLAGVDLFLELGALCLDTERRIIFTEEELKDLARKYLILCPECGRWVERDFWDDARASCKICVEEERIISLRYSETESVPPEEATPETEEPLEMKKYPEKCPKCGYPVHESEVVWVGTDKFQCPSCQTEMQLIPEK